MNKSTTILIEIDRPEGYEGTHTETLAEYFLEDPFAPYWNWRVITNMKPADIGKQGGLARAKNMSPERRSEIARQAALARWAQRNNIG